MIRELSIGGYRLLESFAADLGQLTVVIGANATGKSTLLDCLQMISHCAEFSLTEALGWHGGLASILNASQKAPSGLQWAVTFAKPVDQQAWGWLPLDQGKEFVYEVEIRADRYGEAFAEREVLRDAQPSPSYKTPLKYLEASPKKSLIYDHRRCQLVPFDEAVSPKESQPPAQGCEASEQQTNGGDAGASRPRINTLRLAQMRFFNEYPLVSSIRLLLAGWGIYPGFETGRNSALRTQPAEIRAHPVLAWDGSNLGTVLHEMLTRHDYLESADVLKAFMRSAYPAFKDIFAETTFGAPPRILVRVREAGMTRPMELWDVSDGMLRFLALGGALLCPAGRSLVAVDEPEAGLHPKLIPVVADMLKTASEKTQVLITTHSPELLDCFDIEDVAVMTREDATIAWKRPGSRASLRRMLESVVGDSLGDLHRSGELEAVE